MIHHVQLACPAGSEDILRELSLIAPITAVRGNNDKGSWAAALPETKLVQLEDVFLYVIHDLAQLDLEPQAAGINVVVSGHSHQPLIEERARVLYINPGSAGPRRFTLPVALALLTVREKTLRHRLIELRV